MGVEFSCLSRMKDNTPTPSRKRSRQHIPPPPARRNRKIPPPPPRIRSTTATATNTKIIVSSDHTVNPTLALSINVNPKNQTKIRNEHTHTQRLPINEPTSPIPNTYTTSSSHKPSQLHPTKPFNSNNLCVPNSHQYHNPNTNIIRQRSISRTITTTAISAISSAASIISTLSRAPSAQSSDSSSTTTSSSSHSTNSSSSDSYSSRSSNSTNMTSRSSTSCHTDSERMMGGFSPITPESRTINCSQQPPSTQIISPTQTYNLHLNSDENDIADIITDDDECRDTIDIEEIHRKYDEQIAVAQMRINLQHLAQQSNASQISQLSALSQASQISTLSAAPSQISALSSGIVPCNIVVKQASKVKSDEITEEPVNPVDVASLPENRGSPQSAPVRFTELKEYPDASESHDSALWHCPTSDDLDELDTDFEEDQKLHDSDDQSSYFSNLDQSEAADHINNRSSFASTISTLSRLKETKFMQGTAKKRIPEKLSMSAQLSDTLTASSSLSSSSLPQPKSVKIICEDYDTLQRKDIDRKDTAKNEDDIQPITPCNNIIKHASDSSLPFDHLSLSPEMTARSIKSASLSMNRDDLTAAYSPAGLSSSGDDSLLTSGKLDVEEITKYLNEEDAFDHHFECDKYSEQYVD